MKNIILSALIILSLSACSGLNNTASPAPAITAEMTAAPQTLSPTLPAASPTPAPGPALISKLTEGKSIPFVRTPDDRFILTVEGNDIVIIDGVSYRELGRVESIPTADERSIFFTFSKDGTHAIYRGGSPRYQVIDLINMKPLADFWDVPEDETYGDMFCPSFLHENQWIVYSLADYFVPNPWYDRIAIWDIKNNESVIYFPVLDEEVGRDFTCPVVSPDERWIVAGSSEGVIYIWDLTSGQTQRVIKTKPFRINSVDISPDGRHIAAGGKEGFFGVWDFESGRLLYQTKMEDAWITNVEWAPDEKVVYLWVDDIPSKKFDLASGKITPWDEPIPEIDPYRNLKHLNGYYDADDIKFLFSPSGKELAINGSAILLYDVTTQKLKSVFENPWAGEDWWSGELNHLTFSPDGRFLGAIQRYRILVWDTLTSELVFVHTSADLSYLNKIAFSENGAQLVCGHDNIVEFWDIASGELLDSIKIDLPDDVIRSVEFSDDNEMLYVESVTNVSAKIAVVDDGKLATYIEDPFNQIKETPIIQWPLLVLAREDAENSTLVVEVINLETGNKVEMEKPELTGEFERFFPIALSADGKLLYAKPIEGGKIYFWSTETGELIYQGEAEWTGNISFSADSTMVAGILADGKLGIWDIRSLLPFIEE